MSRSGIRLSPKYGVNPVIPKCYFCGGDKNEIILAGRLKGDVEAPRGVYNMEPCDKCQELMAQGVLLIKVRDGEEGNNPYRLGPQCVVREEYISRAFHPQEFVDNVLQKRVAFVPAEAWDALGLPS